MIFKKDSLKLGLALAVFLFVAITPAQAQRDGTIIIRDTEIENMMREWADPIFKAADISSDSVNIILVQDDATNAFVAGGANIFFFTGLLTKTESPGEITGVLAHELGHIKGGHLIATRSAMERASYESIIGTIVGIGAAVLTGNGDAAAAISVGSSSVAARRFLAHSRLNESSADQAALTYFEEAQMSPSGLISFMRKLESEELLPAHQQSAYVRTHPVTRDRIDALEARAANSPYNKKSYPESWNDQHARLKAKLLAFINPGQVAWTYDERDQSIPARYAYAISYYRSNLVDKALSAMDGLLQAEPENPYFLELKGQMLVDFGKVKEAIPYYERSVAILGDAPLIRIDLGHAIIESSANDEAKIREAITHIERSLKKEPRSTKAHRLLATAYGKLGQESQAKIHLAEEALLQGRYDYAKQLAEGVLKTAQNGSREWLQAKDIVLHAEQAADKEDG
jgi:predicted Zn-dependent protease